MNIVYNILTVRFATAYLFLFAFVQSATSGNKTQEKFCEYLILHVFTKTTRLLTNIIIYRII